MELKWHEDLQTFSDVRRWIYGENPPPDVNYKAAIYRNGDKFNLYFNYEKTAVEVSSLVAAKAAARILFLKGGRHE